MDYSKITHMEYLKKKSEMTKICGGREICAYANCGRCPLSNNGQYTCIELLDPEKAFRIVMDWQKPVDWENVPVDTKILISNNREIWHKRHFAKYENGVVYAWSAGATSWSSSYNNNISAWKYAKLAEVEE
ncbi:MAG: hypothetical protein Q4B26_03745 [Eubacteriales bacterium]|nr:hypothetical protein [Eubacteriales bacterium]